MSVHLSFLNTTLIWETTLMSVQLSFFTYMAINNQWNLLQWIHDFSAKQ